MRAATVARWRGFSMFARVVRYRVPIQLLDEAVQAFEEPAGALVELDGNEGGYLLIDDENGTALTVTFWESRAAMEASEVRASRLRQEAMHAVEGEVEAVDRCRVALDFDELSRT
jgi:heme-degrading monooxygenase HmoA